VKVSVIIPVYNSALYIKKCIDYKYVNQLIGSVSFLLYKIC